MAALQALQCRRAVARVISRGLASAPEGAVAPRGRRALPTVDRYRKGKVFFPAYPILELLRIQNEKSVEISENAPSWEELSLAKIETKALKPYLEPDDPVLHADFFNVKQMCTVEDLFRARVHLGHKTGALNPQMSSYLFGERLGVCIFDLAQTMSHLHKALNFLAHLAYRGGIVLFVANDRANMHLIEKAAGDCSEYSHTRTWLPGTLTASSQMFGNEIRLPDCVILLRTQNSQFKQHDAVVEAAKMLIPTIAIVDSNCSPLLITYPVPGNDDSTESLQLYLKLFVDAISGSFTWSVPAGWLSDRKEVTLCPDHQCNLTVTPRSRKSSTRGAVSDYNKRTGRGERTGRLYSGG